VVNGANNGQVKLTLILKILSPRCVDCNNEEIKHRHTHN